MTKAQRRAHKEGNRRRRAAALVLASLPNPNSNRARRERIKEGAETIGAAMLGIDNELAKAGALPPAVVEVAQVAASETPAPAKTSHALPGTEANPL